MSMRQRKTVSVRLQYLAIAAVTTAAMLGAGASAAFAQSPPTINKSFSPSTISVGGVSTLTVTLTNPNPATILTGINFTDTLPAGLVLNIPSGLTSNCGGVAVAATGPPATLSGSGGTLAGGGSCAITVNVTSTVAGPKVNTTGAVTSTEGGTGGTATATLDVLGPPVFTKSFAVGSIVMGNSTTLTLQITNPNDVALANVTMTDTLPAGLIVASPSNITDTCLGVTTAVVGSDTISLVGSSLTAGASCSIGIDVTGATPGTKVNTATASAATVGTSAPGTATLDVTLPVPAVNLWWLLTIVSAMAAAGVLALRRRRVI